jgi:hypothetical protein
LERSWYECGGAVIVFCGPLGGDGVFRIFPDGDDARWEFCPAGSKLWDWYHQAVWNTHKADPTSLAAHDDLPPLPSEWPPSAAITLNDPAEPSSKHAAHGTPLWTKVEAAGGRLSIFVVLEEDLYESAFGDGCLRDFRAAFFDEAPARALALELSGEHRAAHVRHASLGRGERELTLVIDERSPFDHATVAEVCDSLAAALAG